MVDICVYKRCFIAKTHIEIFCRKKGGAVMALKVDDFIGTSQLASIKASMRGEEGLFFKEWLHNFEDSLDSMPTTYEQDGLGKKAVVHLHYFSGSADWYVTELDCEPGAQLQAFGWGDLGYGAEAGYISIAELIKAGVELDMYWKPKTVAECI